MVQESVSIDVGPLDRIGLDGERNEGLMDLVDSRREDSTRERSRSRERRHRDRDDDRHRSVSRVEHLAMSVVEGEGLGAGWNEDPWKGDRTGSFESTRHSLPHLCRTCVCTF